MHRRMKLDLHNSSDHTTNGFSHCFIIHPRQFLDRCLFTIFIYLFLDKFSVQIKRMICLVLKIFFKQHTSSCIWCFLAYIFLAKRLKFLAIFYSWNQTGPQRFLHGCGPSVSSVYLVDGIDVILSDLAILPNLNFFNVCWSWWLEPSRKIEISIILQMIRKPKWNSVIVLIHSN